MMANLNPQSPQPQPNSRRRTIDPEQKKRLREAWEEHWATPIAQPVDLNWALEIRSNDRHSEPADHDAPESR